MGRDFRPESFGDLIIESQRDADLALVEKENYFGREFRCDKKFNINVPVRGWGGKMKLGVDSGKFFGFDLSALLRETQRLDAGEWD